MPMRIIQVILSIAGAACSSLGSPQGNSPKVPRALINDPAQCVAEKIEALVLTNPNVRKLARHNVLVRSSADRCKVAIISGGGSGHEPSHAGWVAEGMLTAAVIGPIFVSPTADEVLAAIEHCTGVGGCLLVVKNYMTDVAAFSEAAERARATGLKVELVVVGDDVAVAAQGISTAKGERRGIAGSCFVHKIAGAAAEAGESLEQVTKEAREAAASVATMGFALRTCRVPGQAVDERIPDGKMEIGLGIHGEPGAEMLDLGSADEVITLLFEYIHKSEFFSAAKGEQVVLMVNNLGGATEIEVQVASRKACTLLATEKYEYDLQRVFTGEFMSALDMVGLSVSVMKVNTKMLERLDAPTSSDFWPQTPQVLSKITVEPMRKPYYLDKDS